MSHQEQPDAGRAGTAVRSLTTVLLAGLFAVALGACSSDGSGGTDVTIGSGQDADPVTVDFPVFYVKRPAPDPEDDQAMQRDAREVLRFDIGADLYMRDRASPSAPEINITGAETQGLGDIRDISLNSAGTKVLFSMRARFIEGADEEDQPKWAIWEYDIASGTLRQVISSANVRDEGHDIAAHYLPADERIVFSSTRQSQSRAILIDEGKGQFAAQEESGNEDAFVLHVMNVDGSNIHQISFNQSHDLYPSILPNGQIVFTRWERAPGHDQMDLFKMNPDGSQMELLYGANSHNTGSPEADGTPSTIQFLNPRAMPDGRMLAIVRPFEGTDEGGDLILIDTDTYVENHQSVLSSPGLAGPAQSRALPTDVRTIPGPSPGGRYRSAAPLFDGTNRLLVSWSQCRLLEDARIVPCTSDRLGNTTTPPVEAPPLYGVYIYDVQQNTQLPIVAPQEGFMFTEVAAASRRPPITPIPDGTTATQGAAGQLVAENAGVLHIRSVYDIDGADNAPGGIAAVRNPAVTPADQRTARFLRIEKAVSQPDDDLKDVAGTAFGPNRALGMREILGYAPIEPDGSVKVKVPAQVAFMISILDSKGRRLGGVLGSQHNNWLQLVPGEVKECNGCHNPGTTPPRSHGRSDLFTSINNGAPTTGQPFPNTNAAFSLVEMGNTMADVRGRTMCGGSANLSNACPPSVDIIFDDYWPIPTGIPAKFDYCYVSGASNQPSDPATPGARHLCETGLDPQLALPVAPACTQSWNSNCRITINYPTHIHKLWSLDRFEDANDDGVPDVDGMGVEINHKCDSCHSTVDAMGQTQVPPGQLDLSDGLSDNEPDHLRAYEELLSAGRAQALNAMGQLEFVCTQTEVDPVTNVEVCVAFQNAPVYMRAANARNSTFFRKFESAPTAGTIDHNSFLNPAELRLIAEWLDIGAQYFNNPFDPAVPVN